MKNEKILFYFFILIFPILYLYPQNNVKELFEKAWGSDDTTLIRTLREQIVKLSPDSEYGYYCKGWFALKNNDNYTAIDFFNKALYNRKNFWQAFYGRGLAYMNAENYKNSILDLTKVISLSNKLDDVYFFRGYSYLKLGENNNGNDDSYKNAITDFSSTIKINSKYLKAFYFRGIVNYNLDNISDAIADFTEVIKQNPKSSFAYYYRGITYEKRRT
jgi:tetratricopeptide (TPR) repeat protein